MRGYFAVGVEGVSKAMNAGNLFRSAHAMGASFVFTIQAACTPEEAKSDTSKTAGQLPYYAFDSVDSLRLPAECDLVGVELLDEAIDLPSFRHPQRAAYVLGQERGRLSDQLLDRCDFVIRIPTSFCINLATAGAIVVYDRLISTCRFGERPLVPGGPIGSVPDHVHGPPIWVKKERRRRRKAAGESD